MGALGLFIVICGVLLLVVGTQSSSCGGPDEETTRRAVGQRVLNALTETQKADRALESKNYGKARTHVKQLQLELTSALNEIQVEKSP